MPLRGTIQVPTVIPTAPSGFQQLLPGAPELPSYRLTATISLEDPSTGQKRPIASTSQLVKLGNPLSLPVSFNTTGMRENRYNYWLTVQDAYGNILFDNIMRSVFLMAAPGFPPAPAAPAPVSPGYTPNFNVGDVITLAPGAVPAGPSAGVGYTLPADLVMRVTAYYPGTEPNWGSYYLDIIAGSLAGQTISIYTAYMDLNYVLTSAPVPAPTAPAPTGAITSFTTRPSIAPGDVVVSDISWQASVRHWVALELMSPPDYVTRVAGTSTTIREPGSYQEPFLSFSGTAVLGAYKLRAMLVSETGQYLATQYRDVQVVAPAAPPTAPTVPTKFKVGDRVAATYAGGSALGPGTITSIEPVIAGQIPNYQVAFDSGTTTVIAEQWLAYYVPVEEIPPFLLPPTQPKVIPLAIPVLHTDRAYYWANQIIAATSPSALYTIHNAYIQDWIRGTVVSVDQITLDNLYRAKLSTFLGYTVT